MSPSQRGKQSGELGQYDRPCCTTLTSCGMSCRGTGRGGRKADSKMGIPFRSIAAGELSR